MSQKKILVITYYWPPSGGGGVQRWLKFIKYLPDCGWEPIVFTPENPEFDLKDSSLERDVNNGLEVIRFPIWEPFSVYKKMFSKGGDKKIKQGIVIEKSKMSLKDKLVVWVRANFFVPDPRRFWVKPSINFLVPYIKQHNIDVVVTTGPPHSMHLIGLGIKKKCDVKWVADFRDPWSDWDILDKLNVSKLVRSIHKRMERQVMQKADLVLTVSKRLAQQFEEKNAAQRIEVVTNGVDHEDFDTKLDSVVPDKFRLSHMGLLNEIRDPDQLWSALEELCEENPRFSSDLEILLAGMVSGSVLDRIRNSPKLGASLKHLDYISHAEVFEYYKKSSVLLLLLNQTENAKWILPGKLFEYLLANKKILTLGARQSDVADILEETNAGQVFDFDEKQKIKQLLSDAYEQFKKGEIGCEISDTDKFLRKHLTTELSTHLDSLLP